MYRAEGAVCDLDGIFPLAGFAYYFWLVLLFSDFAQNKNGFANFYFPVSVYDLCLNLLLACLVFP
ncbi:hypothetical protein CMI37_26835 [Candidatus Pacearchaeota archaeon]|nr:hypothetical protein [Candidatus Pacearchaeota archaeon]|tara:strand:- start:766 stop:960 length:195 start_codon:yes stop_codon:yes gene_type:complete